MTRVWLERKSHVIAAGVVHLQIRVGPALGMMLVELDLCSHRYSSSAR